MKIAIIGAGNVGGATAIGLMKAGTGEVTITATARHKATLTKFRGTGVETSLDNKAAASSADMVIIAVRPNQVEAVVKDLGDVLDRKIIVLMAAEVPSKKMMEWLGGEARLFLAIPNLAIEFMLSMTFVSQIGGSDQDLKAVKGIFDQVGSTIIVPEDLLGICISIGSCGTAYAMRYIRASAEAAIRLGLDPQAATLAAAQTTAGAATILLEKKTHPEAEIDRVTTPAGLTIRGLIALEEAGFSAAVAKGVFAGTQGLNEK